MTEREHGIEGSDRSLTARRLVGKALVDEYITLDEANRIYKHGIVEVLGIIAKRIEAKGDEVPTVLGKWEMLDQVLEYLDNAK